MHIISKQNKQEISTFFHQIIQWHVYQVYLVFLHMKKLHLAAILKLAVKSSFLKMISFPKGGEHSFCPQPLFLEWWRHCFTSPCLFVCLFRSNQPSLIWSLVPREGNTLLGDPEDFREDENFVWTSICWSVVLYLNFNLTLTTLYQKAT